MADIRIKDLTTTASSTASGDFFVIDGTTGTRKVNAFSPSFGGNATVTGTLTVNGGSSVLTGAAYSTFYADGSTGGNFSIRKSGVLLASLYGNDTNTVLDSGSSTNLILQTGGATRITMDSTRVSIPLTTASTTTSTGALVVSGGVGIAKALFAGESAYFAGAVGATDAVLKNGFGRSANGYAYFDLVGDTTYTDYGMRLLRGNSGANAISQIAHRGTGTLEVVTVDAAPIAFFTNGSNLALTITSGQQVQCNATTASTSTSTGALVIGNGTSGGLGVGGNINAGGVTATKANGTAMAVFSGASGSYADLAFGRTASEHFIGIASGSNQYVTGTAAGDWAFNSSSATASIFIGINGTAISKVDSNDFTIASGKGLKVGNAYVAGAPTATGYIVIKDSTGTSYKIPAEAL